MINRGQHLATWQRWSEVPLLALAIGSLPLLILELASGDLPKGDKQFLYVVNVIVFVAFSLDYAVRFSLSRQRTSFVRGNWGSLLIVVSQLLALFPTLGILGLLRGARAIRVVVVFARFLGLGLAARERGRAFLRKRAASLAFGIAGFTVVSSAVGFTLVEEVGENQRVDSFFDALWWSIATITTVGYGDIYPTTGAGRAIAAFTMIIGISTLAVVTARIAQWLISEKPG